MTVTPTFFNIVRLEDETVGPYRITFAASNRRVVKVERKAHDHSEYDEVPKREWGLLMNQVMYTIGNSRFLFTSDGYLIPRSLFRELSDSEISVAYSLDDLQQMLRLKNI